MNQIGNRERFGPDPEKLIEKGGLRVKFLENFVSMKIYFGIGNIIFFFVYGIFYNLIFCRVSWYRVAKLHLKNENNTETLRVAFMPPRLYFINKKIAPYIML